MTWGGDVAQGKSACLSGEESLPFRLEAPNFIPKMTEGNGSEALLSVLYFTWPLTEIRLLMLLQPRVT